MIMKAHLLRSVSSWRRMTGSSIRMPLHKFFQEPNEKQIPDVLLFDLDMIEKNSVEIQKATSLLNQNVPIIMLIVDTDCHTQSKQLKKVQLFYKNQ